MHYLKLLNKKNFFINHNLTKKVYSLKSNGKIKLLENKKAKRKFILNELIVVLNN